MQISPSFMGLHEHQMYLGSAFYYGDLTLSFQTQKVPTPKPLCGAGGQLTGIAQHRKPPRVGRHVVSNSAQSLFFVAMLLKQIFLKLTA